MAMPKNGNDLLVKIRKGSTAGFSTTDYVAAVESLAGWKAEVEYGTGKESRTVKSLTVTSPDGQVAKCSKEAGYRGMVFYAGVTFNGEDMGIVYLSKVLTEKTSILKDIDGVVGPVVKVVRKGREEARTCPVCLRDILLTGNGRMVHHGYMRPGYGYIVGDCFGVGYEPWEVSPKGMVEYVARVLVPYQTRLTETVAFLRSPACVSIEVAEPDYMLPRVGGKRQMKTVKVTPAEGYKWEHLLKSKIQQAESSLNQVSKDIKERDKMISEWKPVAAVAA